MCIFASASLHELAGRLGCMEVKARDTSSPDGDHGLSKTIVTTIGRRIRRSTPQVTCVSSITAWGLGLMCFFVVSPGPNMVEMGCVGSFGLLTEVSL